MYPVEAAEGISTRTDLYYNRLPIEVTLNFRQKADMTNFGIAQSISDKRSDIFWCNYENLPKTMVIFPRLTHFNIKLYQ